MLERLHDNKKTGNKTNGFATCLKHQSAYFIA